jgi:uncharacterized protein YunC (DUF1805 family)
MIKWTKLLVAFGLTALLLPLLAGCGTASTVAPASIPAVDAAKAVHQTVQLTNKQADGYVIPIGKVNIVCVVTDVGMVGCGAFDVMALDANSYPAVRVKSTDGKPVATIDDLKRAVVKEANAGAAKLGIKADMTGSEALDLL